MMAIPFFISTGVTSLDAALTITASVFGIFAGTYVFTECRFWLQSRGNGSRYQGREPLTLPYFIPYLAGFTRLVGGAHGMYEYALRKAPQDAPVLLKVGPIGIYVLFGDKNIKMIFKNSKVLGKDASSQMLMRGNGMTPEDLHPFAEDRSGTGTIPKVPTPNDQRIWKKTHDAGVNHLLAGPAVNQLTNGFIKHFNLELDKEPKGHKFTVPLWDYVKKVMFVGSTTALAGQEIFKVNPGLTKAYWDYDESFLMIALGLPKIIYPKGYARRDAFLDSAERWLESAYKKFDERDSDSEWEPQFGSAYMRTMLWNIRDAGVRTRGQAAAILSIIWAINSNAVPCAIWILLESMQHPGLIQRLRSEITPTTYTSQDGELAIHIPKLISETPLLTSMYQECLRTRGSNTITRQMEEDLECDGYILKKGRFLMSPSWLPMHSGLWDVPGHPASQFWPERFVEMPKMEGRNFELAMKPDNWFPYGGGNMICTGRFFAKQEILAAAAILIMKFDIEPKQWITHDGKKSARPALPDEAFAGSGLLPPDRDIMVTMRRTR